MLSNARIDVATVDEQTYVVELFEIGLIDVCPGVDHRLAGVASSQTYVDLLIVEAPKNSPSSATCNEQINHYK
jgi:hypothetical protein